MDLNLDARIIGLRALQEEIVNNAGWNATQGWRKRHGGTSLCGLGADLTRAAFASWRAILNVGITPALVRWEIARFKPAAIDFLLLIYFWPVLFTLPAGKRMIRKRRILRYNYRGFSKCRAAMPVAR